MTLSDAFSRTVLPVDLVAVDAVCAPGLASCGVFLLDVLLLVMLVHVGAGGLHLRIFGDRLLKMELPVSGLGLLFQLGHLLEGLVRASFLVVLVVADNRLCGNLCFMAASTPEFSCSTSWILP